MYRKKEQMVAIAMDFKKAYVSIKRETMVQILKELRIDSKIIDFIVRIYRDDSTKIQLEKSKKIEIEVTISGIRQGCTSSIVLFELITYKIIEEMRKTEGIKILGRKIICLFYANDGLILAEEKAERSIELIREIGGKYGIQLNERKSQCILFNTREKWKKIYIEVVEELKYLGVIVLEKRNVFEGQKNEMMKKIKRLSLMTNSVIEKSCHRVMMGKTYWKGVVLPSALYGAEVNRHERRRNRQIEENREQCNEKNLESTKVGCTSSNKRRDRNKQHEVENSKEQASIPKKDRNRK